MAKKERDEEMKAKEKKAKKQRAPSKEEPIEKGDSKKIRGQSSTG